MRNIECCEDRLKSIVMIDKSETSNKITKVIKAEILYLLNNYFDITSEDLDLDIRIDEGGDYNISIIGKSKFLKVAQVIA